MWVKLKTLCGCEQFLHWYCKYPPPEIRIPLRSGKPVNFSNLNERVETKTRVFKRLLSTEELVYLECES